MELSVAVVQAKDSFVNLPLHLVNALHDAPFAEGSSMRTVFELVRLGPTPPRPPVRSNCTSARIYCLAGMVHVIDATDSRCCDRRAGDRLVPPGMSFKCTTPKEACRFHRSGGTAMSAGVAARQWATCSRSPLL
jgi:hypothetical protein